MNKTSRAKKVLLFFTQNPYPGKTGTHKRCLTIINALQQLGCQVTFFSHAEYGPYRWDQESLDFFNGKGVAVDLYKSNQADERFAANARAQNQDHLNLACNCPPGLVAQFSDVYNSVKPDIVFVFYAYSSGLLSAVDLSSSLTIMDSIDLVSLSSMMQHVLYAHLGEPPYDPLRVNPAAVDEDFFERFNLAANAEEFKLYDLYDYTLAVSQHEASEIARNTRTTKAEYLPVTFPIPSMRNSYAGGPVFVAADNLFNVQAYLYLSGRVMPMLVRDNPKFELKVAGEITRKLVPVPGMDFRGFVPDLTELYAGACCAVCPIIGGTGMSVKVIEAMAHGVPVVVLRNSTQESPVKHGINGFIANNAEEFAYFVTLLFKDRALCARMGSAARETVVQNFSDHVILQKLEGIIAGPPQKSPQMAQSPRKPAIRVLYDISVLGLGSFYPTARTGIYRVVEHVVRGLAKYSDIELSFCATQGLTENTPDTIQACKYYLATHPEFNQIPFYESDLPTADIFHSPFHALPSEVKTPIRFWTIYDLIPILFPEFIPDGVTRMQKMAFSLVRPGDRILCISHATEDDLCRVTGIGQEQVTVTHLAADPGIFFPCTDSQQLQAVRQKYNIGNAPYLLSLCTLEPRKNIDHVIRAFARLVRDGLADETRLVLTGTKGWDFNRIFGEIDSNPDLHTRIVLTGYVPDEDLAPLYSGALAFVYMSVYEGFGLPPLEAMQCGVPVITSNTSSLPEVVGDAGIMLDPADEDGLCQAITEIQANKRMRRELSIRSLKQARFFSWDQTVKKTVEAYRCAVADSGPAKALPPAKTEARQSILIDGVFFQLSNTGIARLWGSLLAEWAKTDFASSIILLDRAGTAPKIAGIRTRVIPAYDFDATDKDRSMLQAICDEEGADLFVSTYYTTPLTTPSVFYAYDMIPENTPFFNLNDACWREKHHGIAHASAFIAISRYTAMDLVKEYPPARDKVTIAYPAVDRAVFSPASPHEVVRFKEKYGITGPYLLFVGNRQSYKNAQLLFEGCARLPAGSLQIVCVGGLPSLEPYLRELTPDSTVHMLSLADDELRLAYSGAVAFVCSSAYEGFGLPILEAMSCDCPVITCQNSSLPEAAGAAALFVASDAPDEMAASILHIQNAAIRDYLIASGRRQVQKFSWSKMAEEVRGSLVETYRAVKHM